MKVRVAQEGHRDHREVTETHREKKGSVNLSENNSVRSVKEITQRTRRPHREPQRKT